MPLSRGLFGFVALRCYAEDCAFSLSTRPEGQDASVLLCGAYHLLCLCARLFFCMTGVLEFDLT